jgi:phosphoribosylaminoimidazole-succinocarboxamide synthase
MTEALFKTNFPNLKLVGRGKVRDIYDLGDVLLIVATDRISAFDVVMPTPIPNKGIILTQLSIFWLNLFSNFMPHHLISADPADYPAACQPYVSELAGRSMLVKKAKVLQVECIVRGYLAGSGWKDYLSTGIVCGIPLSNGLKQAQKLPYTMFTPSTKAEQGEHDENISFDELIRKIGFSLADEVRERSLELYYRAAGYALERGIIIADTKFEFGVINGQLILVDEVLTPDSSRFWPADSYKVGTSPESFDKQYVRDYLKEIGWKISDPPPALPREVIAKTQEKYLNALEKLTGHCFNL